MVPESSAVDAAAKPVAAAAGGVVKEEVTLESVAYPRRFVKMIFSPLAALLGDGTVCPNTVSALHSYSCDTLLRQPHTFLVPHSAGPRRSCPSLWRRLPPPSPPREWCPSS